jgi:hypothetical protein
VLPDGRTVLVTSVPNSKWEDAHIDAITLTTKQRKTVLTNAADGRYSPTGHIVLMRNAARALFRAEITGMSYAVTRDGQRFLIVVHQANLLPNAPVTVVTNWLTKISK